MPLASCIAIFLAGLAKAQDFTALPQEVVDALADQYQYAGEVTNHATSDPEIPKVKLQNARDALKKAITGLPLTTKQDYVREGGKPVDGTEFDFVAYTLSAEGYDNHAYLILHSLCAYGGFGGGKINWNWKYYGIDAPNPDIMFTCNKDSSNEKELVQLYKDKLKGEVLVKSISFGSNPTVGEAKPRDLTSQKLINNSTLQQEMSYTVEYSKGSTTSWSNTFGFGASCTSTIEVSEQVEGFGPKGSYALTYSEQFTGSWGGGTSKGTTTSYTFPVQVPPHTTYIATSTVQEATVAVDYTMVLQVGDTEVTVDGVWSGVTTSQATYDVQPANLSVLV